MVRLSDAISRSRKRCEIQLRRQLITDRKSYMGYPLQQKLMTLNDLEDHYSLVIVMRVVTKRLRLELRDLLYKVALYTTALVAVWRSW